MSVNSFFQGIDLIPEMPDISHISFENIIDLPDNVYVHDFESNNKFQDTSDSFSIGRYNEKRPNMYEGDLFEKTNRFIHMGIDIGAPVGTPVKSFYDGEIFLFKYNDQKLDYGHTIITKHQIRDQNIYALYGHLSNSSLENKKIGQKRRFLVFQKFWQSSRSSPCLGETMVLDIVVMCRFRKKQTVVFRILSALIYSDDGEYVGHRF